ncbi:MAG: glycosyltransferase [Planctomycetota bacterium]|nr:glycosyltransferase [Planctomycetota bacterium]MDA1114114.1 glycosyltransferase [Planctomycetota bacterium]
MRIAVLLDQWHADGGGLEQYLHFVLPELVSRGHGVLLAARGATSGTPQGVTAVDLRRGRLLPRPWSDWQEAREAVRVADHWNADRVWGLRAIPCKGSVWQPMGGSSPDVQKARGRVPSRRTRALMRLEEETLRAAACVLPMSPMVAREIEKRAPGKQQTMLPLPLLLPPSGMQIPGKRGRISEQTPLRILHCGRDPLRHGAKASVEWFRCLKPRGIYARLDLWAKTIAHAERAIGASAEMLFTEGVVLHPWDGGFRQALQSADLLFHPTLYDSFSLVCLEAAAAGVPVMTTRMAGVAELLPSAMCATEPRELPDVAAARGMELFFGACAYSEEAWLRLGEEVRSGFQLQEHVAQIESVLERFPR